MNIDLKKVTLEVVRFVAAGPRGWTQAFGRLSLFGLVVFLAIQVAGIGLVLAPFGFPLVIREAIVVAIGTAIDVPLAILARDSALACRIRSLHWPGRSSLTISTFGGWLANTTIPQGLAILFVADVLLSALLLPLGLEPMIRSAIATAVTFAGFFGLLAVGMREGREES